MSGAPRTGHPKPASPFKQPKAVYALAFACVVSFMGIGLVDPILPAIASDLDASPSQVTMLFTSYLLVTAVAMLFTGWISSHIGAKRTLIYGLSIIVVFSALAGLSDSIGGIVGFRAGWGVGNAMFIATSLAVIVASASGGFVGAIVLYEAALGLGMATGPLLGGLLGNISWRGPFLGVAGLMLIALIATITMVAPTPKPVKKTSILDPLKALKHRGLLTMSLMALCYNWAFFTVLGYAPFPMGLDAIHLGYVFFGWGLLVAVFSVFGAPWLQRTLGIAGTLYLNLALFTVIILVIGIWVHQPSVLIPAVIATGIFIGVNNTVTTQAVMTVSPVERPVASAAYGFVRFIGGGLAPLAAGKLVEHYNMHVPFIIGAGALLIGLAILASGHKLLRQAEEAQAADTAAAAGSDAPAAPDARAGRDIVPVDHAASAALDGPVEGEVVAAIDSTETADRVVDKALRVAAAQHLKVHVVHALESAVASDTALDGEDASAAAAAVSAQLDRLATAGVPAAGFILFTGPGRPADHAGAGHAVASYANRIDARSLVIGAPTHGGLSALMDASATQEIWRTARTDVSIVTPEATVPLRS
ncbi:MFS transporter [Arthrobacter sp. JSM 101049]|uniref:MFS transporter n=1 Tax=Arthrobacter sp. JSM 101049 TaxID=929097 RepID=UPI0035641FFF